VADLTGKDTTGKWLDPESDGAMKEKEERESSSEEEFSGEVHEADDDAQTGQAVEDVDFSAAVSDGKADVGSIVEESGVDEVLKELDESLVGLDPVKRRIREMAALLVIGRLREEMDLESTRPTLHMSFTGSPGTGKTTVALRMASILHRLGYIDKGQLVAVTRDDLVGQYVGHTAPKTKDVVKKAMGGVLFIDEAYYLHRPENERDYGQEAIEVLLQTMESERENMVVIFAGYKDRMEDFFRANPGMGSRVAHHIDFPDYEPDELMAIAELMIEQQGYEFSDEAKEAFKEYLERRREQPRFANGRSVRNAIERARLRQAMRLFDSGEQLTKEDLVTIEGDDIRKSRVFSDTWEQPPPGESEDGGEGEEDDSAGDEAEGDADDGAEDQGGDKEAEASAA
jgi:probable Rubsico expression protein CbbX